jgi:GT2 family glycosyltransferase
MKRISCIVPVRPGTFPHKVIDTLRRVDYPLSEIEVLVVEGSQPSRQRNMAAKEAQGELLFFLDDDSFVDTDCIRQALAYLTDEKVGAVGGPALTYEGGTFLEDCFGEVTGAYWGGFITRFRHRPVGEARPVSGEELILCNLMVKKDYFFLLSGLKEQLYPSEDPEFAKRMNQKGVVMYYNPRMTVRRTRRKNIFSFIAQSFDYSFGRAKHIFYGFRKIDLFFFIPTFFTLYLGLLPFLPFGRADALLGLYAFLVISNAAVIAAKRHRPAYLFALPPMFFLLHVSYGVGLLIGLLRLQGRRRVRPPIRITRVELAAA